MIRFIHFLVIAAFSTNGTCQLNPEALIGKHVSRTSIGGGFTGSPDGGCMSLPPDYVIDNIISIDSNFVAYKISDTTAWSGSLIDLNCDTLYIGRAEVVADTVVVTYNLKPECNPFLVHKRPIEKLEKPIIEKYVAWIADGIFLGLILCDSDWEQYEKRE